ncbi:hypothetical protein M433DRAFT_133859 [Acidomyces richmondensis BFW]|nr:hypothetical protein M433DRAFT_133859 [Acidomyces richmondensis BFW]
MPCYAHVNVRIVLTFKSTGDRTSILSIVSTPLATPVTSIQAVPSSTAAPASTSRAALSVSTPIYHGLTSDEKLGIGIGVGVGVPIILGIIAALYFLSKRRPSRQSDGPYGPVMRNDKGADERASYSSPRMLPQEMQNLSPAAPFLPTPAQTDAMAYHGKDSEYHEAELAMLSTLAARDVPVCLQQHTEGLYYNNTSAARPMTSREMYNLTSANIDMVRPATAPGSRCLSKIAHDEPPSPVSPVSPISSAGSRPPSLMQNDYQHDL